MSWEEQATWHRPGGDVAVRRMLRLARTEDGWWVRFEDGRDFHRWAPGEEVVHDCAPDTYRGRVGGTPQAWTIVWDVSGPGKDYTMTHGAQPRLTRSTTRQASGRQPAASRILSASPIR